MSLLDEFPDAYRELLRNKEILEHHYRTPCDLEFTIEKGELYVLNARQAKMSAKARVKTAIDFFLEGKTTLYEALSLIDPEAVHQLIGSEITNKHSLKIIGTGLPASPGSATGKVLLRSPIDIYTRLNQKVIFVCEEVVPEDIHILFSSEGALTTRGGKTSHAAVVMRGMGKSCVTGFAGLVIDISNNELLCDTARIEAGSWITIDGSDGSVFQGKGQLNNHQLKLVG